MKTSCAYKLTDDLFLSNTVVPKGQNHGMFMVLDMSGSMGNHMEGTIEQLLIQVSFLPKKLASHLMFTDSLPVCQPQTHLVPNNQ